MPEQIVLEPDQIELVTDIRAALKEYNRVLVRSTAGSGKTVVALYIIKKYIDAGKRAVFVVPRRQLLEQTSLSMERYVGKHSFIAAGRPYDYQAQSFVGMMQTMAGKINGDVESGKYFIEPVNPAFPDILQLPPADIVILDEGHYASDMMTQIIAHYRKIGAKIIILTATPKRADGRGMHRWADTIVHGKPVTWLIENKRLAEYDYAVAREIVNKGDIPRTKGQDFTDKALATFMEGKRDKIVGNVIDEYRRHCEGKRTLVACVSIAESQATCERFNSAGIKAAHVDGNTPKGELKRIFEAYVRREIKVVCYCDLLGFGFDLAQFTGNKTAQIEALIDCQPTMSLAKQIQKWFRALRYHEGRSVIVDMVGNIYDFGSPEMEHEWTLEDEDYEDALTKTRKRAAMNFRKCGGAGCFQAVPLTETKCRVCGHVFSENDTKKHIAVVAGMTTKLEKADLRRINEEAKKKAKDEKSERRKALFREAYKKAKLEGRKTLTLEEVTKIGQELGYKNPAWWGRNFLASVT